MEHFPELPRMPRNPQKWSTECRSDLPSTRAGGQDDGSYTNSFKLLNVRLTIERWPYYWPYWWTRTAGGSLGCRHDIYCVCREDICCIKSQDICCSGRKDTRRLNEIDDTLVGRLWRPTRVWWMRLRSLVSFLPLQQMSCLLMEQMSSLQIRQMSCLQPRLPKVVLVQQ